MSFYEIIVKVNNKNLKYFKNIYGNIKTLYNILLCLSLVVIALSVTNGITTNLFTNAFAQIQQIQTQQQQQEQTNKTNLILKDLSSLQGSSFKIDNMTFSHHMASVNGIQIHYVIGGHGPPVVLLHGLATNLVCMA